MPTVQKSVLIVENDEELRQRLVAFLYGRGYGVAQAANGREALDYLRVSPAPSVIVLAMLLPVLDGWRFLEEFDRLDVRPKPRVIIMTSSPAIGAEWAKAHGCAGILRKPIKPEDLLDEIRRCLKD
jgi:CheY-like chemotaxis protein